MRLAATLLALTLLPAAAHTQTDAMPPETMAPATKPAKPPLKPATQLFVTINGTPNSYSIADLKALPQASVLARDGHTGKMVTFTGPLVADVLAKSGLPSTDVAHKAILSSYVLGRGTDGYTVLYSAAELEPLFSTGQAIVALQADNLPIPSGLQLVTPLDAKPARWIHALTSLTVITPALPR